MALEKIGGIHAIEQEYFTTCFKQGLNSMDRAQLPSLVHLSLAQCVHKLTVANGHDGRDISGWVPVNMTAPIVTAPIVTAPVEPIIIADVLAATVAKQLQENFPRGRNGWRPRGGSQGTGRAPTPGSNAEKSKQNKLTHIKCFSCQEFGRHESDCPKKTKLAADVAAFMAMMQSKDEGGSGNGQPGQG